MIRLLACLCHWMLLYQTAKITGTDRRVYNQHTPAFGECKWLQPWLVTQCPGLVSVAITKYQARSLWTVKVCLLRGILNLEMKKHLVKGSCSDTLEDTRGSHPAQPILPFLSRPPSGCPLTSIIPKHSPPGIINILMGVKFPISFRKQAYTTKPRQRVPGPPTVTSLNSWVLLTQACPVEILHMHSTRTEGWSMVFVWTSTLSRQKSLQAYSGPFQPLPGGPFAS